MEDPPWIVFVKFVFQVPTVRFCPHGLKLCAGAFYIDMTAHEAEGSVMSLIHVSRRITTDLEMKYAESKTPYRKLHFERSCTPADHPEKCAVLRQYRPVPQCCGNDTFIPCHTNKQREYSGYGQQTGRDFGITDTE